MTKQARYKEVIGRIPILDYLYAQRPSATLGTVNTTTLDYEWWDKFRHGMQEGYEIASRLVSPIAKIRTVWALGDGVSFRLRANMDLARITYTNDALKEWAASIRSQLAILIKDLQELADQYVIVNLDGSISVSSPDTVTAQRDKLDYRYVLSVTVTNRLADPLSHLISRYIDGIAKIFEVELETANPFAAVEPVTMPEATANL